jgi:hypothetical protein
MLASSRGQADLNSHAIHTDSLDQPFYPLRNSLTTPSARPNYTMISSAANTLPLTATPAVMHLTTRGMRTTGRLTMLVRRCIATRTSRIVSTPAQLRSQPLASRPALASSALPRASCTRSFSNSHHSHPSRTSHESLFSWHKHPVPIVSADLEPQLVAFFTTIAQSQGHHHPGGHHHASGPHHPTQHEHEHGAANQAASSAPPPHADGTSGSGSGPNPPPHPSYTRQAVEISQAILSALNPHAHMSTSVRIRNIMVALLGCFVIASASVYIFRDDLKGRLSEQTADVAARSLNNEEVQSQVNVLSAEVVRKLLNDPVIMANCLSFLQTLFASAETRASLITLLQGTIRDPSTLAMLTVFASDLLKEVMNKPETVQQLTQLLRRAITEPGNEAALQVLFKNFANDEKTQQMVAQLCRCRDSDSGRANMTTVAEFGLVRALTCMPLCRSCFVCRSEESGVGCAE